MGFQYRGGMIHVPMDTIFMVVTGACVCRVKTSACCEKNDDMGKKQDPSSETLFWTRLFTLSRSCLCYVCVEDVTRRSLFRYFSSSPKCRVISQGSLLVLISYFSTWFLSSFLLGCVLLLTKFKPSRKRAHRKGLSNNSSTPSCTSSPYRLLLLQ